MNFRAARRRDMRVVGALFVLVGLLVGCESNSKPSTGASLGPIPSAKGATVKVPSPGAPPSDAERTASGLVSKVLRPGSGKRAPTKQDAVRVHFAGWNEKGKRFEGTHKQGKPATFALTGVIAGWAEALMLMKEGELRRVWVPDDLGYPGRPGYPRGPAIFDIELVKILKGDAPPKAPRDVAMPPPEAERSESGLAYRFLAHGNGKDKPRPWDRVKLDTTCWKADGTFVETQGKPGKPAVFDMDQVIPGWAQTLTKMSVGDRMRIWVPEALAYKGRRGRPEGPLVFDLTLRAIERRPEPPRPPPELDAPPKRATKRPSGLAYLALEKGDGDRHPGATSKVEVHYSGWTSDGELFDSSVVRGHPATVPLDHMMPGWSEGVQQMVEGDRFLFWIPERLAYDGKPGGPKGMLVYEIELRKIR